jgi:hypothetical protein
MSSKDAYLVDGASDFRLDTQISQSTQSMIDCISRQIRRSILEATQASKIEFFFLT